MPFATFRSQALFYTEHKKGPASRPPLMLIHGAGGDYLHWPPQLRHLPDETVYALDLPGHGRSAGDPASTVTDKAQAVLALLDHLQIKSAVIGGHSMGGAMTQLLALEQPERVAGLVLVGTGAKLGVAPQILDGLVTDFESTVGLIIEWEFGPNAPENVKRLAHRRMLEGNPQVLLGDWNACNAFDVRERLGEIKAPTLVLCGAEDKMTPEKFSRFLAQHIPNTVLKLFPGAGHMLPLEQPQAVAQAVGEFLKRTVISER